MIVGDIMRVKSSIVAVIVLLSFPTGLLIWQANDPYFGSRDQIVAPLAYFYAFSGAIAASISMALAFKQRLIAFGFGVYAMIHGIGWLYFSWRQGSHIPDIFDILAHYCPVKVLRTTISAM